MFNKKNNNIKNKLGIKTRVFLSFSLFIIIVINIFSILLYFSAVNNFKKNTYETITNEYETIKTFIDLQKSNIFSLPDYEIKKINSLGFFFYIGNNDSELQKKYKLGFSENNNKEILFRGDYKGYNIIIGKNIEDINKLQQIFFEMTLLLNIFIIFSILLFSYFITKISIKPLSNLSKFLSNYDIRNNNKLLENNYGNTEIGELTNSLNKFIKYIINIFNSQKDFIQDVSHELKTPLMQIDSNIELIENKIEDIKIKEKLEDIKKSVKNIDNIVSNLGFILRGEKKLVKKEKININCYLEKFIKNFSNETNKKNIKIIIQNKEELIIENNLYYLDRLFGNLISNAINYNNGNNEIKIIINKNKVEIIDEGIGIKDDEIKKIFNRFYRNKDSGIYYKNGNGLGLVIVKKICDLFGWKIRIESTIGIGSKFIIIFNS